MAGGDTTVHVDVMTLKRQAYNPRVSLRPERKNALVTFQEYSETGTDAYGQPSGSWGDLDSDPTEWVNINPINNQTVERAHQLFSDATHRVLLDYRPDIVRTMRFKYDSRMFWIGHVRDLYERRITLELLVTEMIE